MKVSGTNRLTAGAAGNKKASAAAGGFSIDGTGPVRSPGATLGSGPIAAVDALLALQAADPTDDATDRRAKAVADAEEMLDLLDGIKIGVLSGRIPRSLLDGLTAVVARERAQIEDPRLARVLDEIDLRARVEIAKYER